MRAREALGLPTDRPVLMTGHQPGFWHPGILAKYLAVDALGEAQGAGVAWVVVDQDEADVGAIEVPRRRDDGVWERSVVRLLGQPAPGEAACVLPARTPGDWPAEGLPSVVRSGLARARERLAANSGAESLAEQGARACLDALCDVLPDRPLVVASRLLDVDECRELTNRLQDDAAQAVRTYNEAVRAHPASGMTLLEDRPGRKELPLWRITPGGGRGRVRVGELAPEARDTIAPRALWMTLLLRRFACDLFVHGMGGWRYDRVMEAWAREWLAEAIAPMTLASASVRLEFGISEPLEESEIARRIWTAHHARHSPSLGGRADVEARKRELVREIGALRERGEDASGAYSTLMGLLDSYRADAREPLEMLRRDADAARQRSGESALAVDRTWASVLHPSESLRALREAIGLSMGLRP